MAALPHRRDYVCIAHRKRQRNHAPAADRADRRRAGIHSRPERLRGAPVPVADLGAIVSGRKTRPTRLIAARAATGKIALAVQAVTGVATIGLDACRDLPPLLRDAATDTIAAIGAGTAG